MSRRLTLYVVRVVEGERPARYVVHAERELADPHSTANAYVIECVGVEQWASCRSRRSPRRLPLG